CEFTAMNLLKQLPILAALAFASCHSMSGLGMSLSALRGEVGAVALMDETYDSQSAPLPTAQLPLRLGIVPPVSCSTNWRDNTVNLVFGSWSDRECEIIDDWARDARASGFVEHYEYLPSLLVDSAAPNVLEAVRGAARSRNLDAVLIVRAGSTIESSSTMLSVLDLAIVPAFVLPTGDFKATAVMEGTVIDTQSGYPYAVGSAESSYEKSAPSLIADVKDFQRKARLRALRSMSSRMVASVHSGVRADVDRGTARTQARLQRQAASEQYWIGDPVPMKQDARNQEE
ncbi:MAG: hypothetical protein P1V35_13925, partial [Planctomycetota bacterium]|nr:hypothetical protein [Planctomycetota bacterium]